MSVLVTRRWHEAHRNPDVAEVIVYANGGKLPLPPEMPLPPPLRWEDCGHEIAGHPGERPIRAELSCQHPVCRRKARIVRAVLVIALLLFVAAMVAIARLP